MRTHSLANGFAIQIEDVDLAAALDDETFDAIRTLWMEHRVAIFPNQNLDDDQLVAFTERFGPLFVRSFPEVPAVFCCYLQGNCCILCRSLWSGAT